MTAHNAKDGFERLLTRGLRQGLNHSAAACPDADTLAAYCEHSLASDEAKHWELHFSACASCQQQLAAMARSEPEAPAAAPFRLLNWRWLAPLATAAAVALLWIALRPPQPWAPADAVQPEAPAVASQAPPAEKEKAPTEESKDQPASRAATHAAAGAANAGPKLAARQAPAEPPMAEATALNKQATGRLEEKRATDAIAALSDKAPVESKAQERLDVKTDQNRQNAAETLKSPPVPAAEPAQQKSDLRRAAAAPADESRESAEKAGERDAFAKAKKESGDSGAFRARPAVGMLALRASEPGFTSPDGKMIWRFSGTLLQRSVDAGKTWATSLTAEHPLAAGACASEKVCWAVGQAGLVFRTVDAEKWEKLSEPVSADLVAVQVSGDASALVIAADGKRYRTTDGGKSWKAE